MRALRNLSVLMLMCATLSGCMLIAYDGIVGSGVQASEDRDVSDFRAVDVSGVIHTTIRPGDAYQVTVEGDDNLVPLIHTDVSGEQLQIYTEGGSIQPKLPLKVTIVCPALDQIEVSGACTVVVEELQTADLSVSVSGVSKLNVRGGCESLQAEVSGSSNVDLVELNSVVADFELSGASKLSIHATESITGSASGASTFLYSGTDNVKVQTSGVAKVKEL